MIWNFILLQTGNQGAGWSQLIFFLAIALVFYFFMIRPQQKKQKDQRKFIEQIKKGDKVVTFGGIHGKILSMDGDTVTLEIDRGVKVTFEKSAISLEATKKYN